MCQQAQLYYSSSGFVWSDRCLEAMREMQGRSPSSASVAVASRGILTPRLRHPRLEIGICVRSQRNEALIVHRRPRRAAMTCQSSHLPSSDVVPILLVRPPETFMSDATTTTLSSKGQVVIPEEIRTRLGLKPGARFVVLGDRDVVILKVLQPPDKREFGMLLQQARVAAKQSGVRRGDIARAVATTRRAHRRK